MRTRLGICIMGALFVLASAEAQEAPKFDVTSVKPNRLAPRQTRPEFECSPNGRFVSFGQGLRRALLWAYDIQAYQFAGLPDWVDSADARFDIEAKTEKSVSQDQCRLMVQALLADRFKLSVHREAKALPVYVLVVAKNGPKFKKATPNGPDAKITVNGSPVRVGIAPGTPSDQIKEIPKGWSMQQLAGFLSTPMFVGGRPIFERTGLEGLYEFNLDFSFSAPGAPPSDAPVAPDVFAALQDQLGLKLEDRKEDVQMLVIDHLERPDAN
jgi:uncharacterized protein (TIGR03435 family)